jgi:hypothetical protein
MNLVHSQNEFYSTEINPLFEGEVIIEFKISCLCVGIYKLNSLQKFSKEKFCYSSDGYFKISQYLPKNTVSLRIRNASTSSYIDDFQFISTKFLETNLLSNKFNLNFEKFFFIHTNEKTMSISVEKYLHKFNNNLFVARTHKLNPIWYGNLKYYNQIDLDNIFNLNHIFDICKKKSKPIIILTGLRHPIWRIISLTFELYGEMFVKLNLTIESILDFVEKSIAEKLKEHEDWLINDYFKTHNLDENSLKFIQKIDNCYVLINENNNLNNLKIYFYKVEDGQQNIKMLIDDILKIQHNEIFPEENMSKNKVYSILYFKILSEIKKKNYNYEIPTTIKKFYNLFGYKL